MRRKPRGFISGYEAATPSFTQYKNVLTFVYVEIINDKGHDPLCKVEQR